MIALKSFIIRIIPKTTLSYAARRAYGVASTAVQQSYSINPSQPATHMKAIDIAMSTERPINTWTVEEIKEIYNMPLMELAFQAQVQHRKFHDPTEVQLCTLLSIKTGGCTEDCKYCAQSNRYDTGVEAEKMISIEEVLAKAKTAKENGSTRFCMGAAWREMKGRKSGMKKITEMVKKINNELKLETCVTLGMIDKQQADDFAKAGLTAYNHNIDTSREHYPNVISTRAFSDRLATINNVQEAGINACTGGILGLGETEEDHVSFLHTLSTMKRHPESLPINRLVPIKGTPMAKELENLPANSERKLKFEQILKTIATARLIMPNSIIRLAAGRYTMKEHEQFLCFMCGCNAIFTGEKMLTTMCNGWKEDIEMLKKWGLKPMKSFERKTYV
ncbi:biotin synthase [Saccharomycopsis crataegensis]|uniref:biotin synthase n=1 Tax=Saccharomycopsis crataegensis TaxID=43959 RepID=A0AAV5QG33_9ASCO|nr:biotin synthase [Saccharomycopsis crataegensis]